MLENLKNILIINSGGGFGDTVQHIPLLNYLNKNYPNLKIYFYSNDYENFYFENKLKYLKPKNLIVIKHFPKYFGFRYEHYFISKKLMKNLNFSKFCLIIDNQTKIRNVLIYKKIPHKYFYSPTLRNFFCYPSIFYNKNKNVIGRVLDYFKHVEKKNINLDYNINIDKKFLFESEKIIQNKICIGFSLVSGHAKRMKEFNKIQLLKVINYFRKKYIPVFFIEKKHHEMIDLLKKNFPESIFPEHNVAKEFNDPQFLIALSRLMKFNISIDNGVAHLLAFSNKKTFVFYPGNMEKFKPQISNVFGYNCKDYKAMSELESEKIIKFIEANL